MAYVGLSRPASGLDHYFSHCWEMMALVRGEESDLHGIQVGVGVLLTLRIYEHLRELHPTMEHVYAAIEAFDAERWEANLRRVFGPTAEDMLAIERRAGKNKPEGRLRRAKRAIENWDRILHVASHDAPTADELEALMKRVGMPTRPCEIGISDQDVIDAFVCSRDVRDKFQLSSMLWDIGYMDEVAEWLRGIL
jgi:glycerol-1-phosphate dehydrogenase [NAD(P)+]